MKLLRAQNSKHNSHHQQNSKHNSHQSTKFARATLNYLEELAGVLGPAEVTSLSQDVKRKVLIGLTAANKQSSLIIHLEYKIVLPDHNYVMASQNKLIPSVIGSMEAKKNHMNVDAVTLGQHT